MADKWAMTTTQTISDELMTALAAVRQASFVCQAVQGRLVSPETIEKKDKSPVTVADFASQAVVCALLGEEAQVVGEEDAKELRGDERVLNAVVEQVSQSMGKPVSVETVLSWIDRGGAAAPADGRYWTLDPIDGTKGFLRAEQYAVALGLIEKGQVIAGVLGCPNLPNHRGGKGALLIAERGRGAAILTLDDEISAQEPVAIRVSDLVDPSAARFCESVESGHSDQDQSVQIAKALGITTEPVRMDSQCKYATVARGEAQIYLRLPTRPGYEEKIWDHAAGLIVVEEAGGTVTDITGKPLDFGQGGTLKANRGVVATNGPIHDQVIAAIAKTS